MISSVTSTGATSSPELELTRARPPSARPSRSASSGWICIVQRSLPLTSAGRLCIQELLERSWRRPISTRCPFDGSAAASSASRRGMSATISAGASSILPDGGAQHLGEPLAHRAHVDRRAGSPRASASVRPSGSAPKPSPNGPTRIRKSSSRSGPRRSPSSTAISSGVAPLDRRARQRDLAPDQRPDDELVPGLEVGVGALAGGDRRQAQEDLPLLGRALGRVDHRRRVVGDAAHRELVERGVVVGLGQRLGGGEDDVGVAGRLVDVDVDARP